MQDNCKVFLACACIGVLETGAPLHAALFQKINTHSGHNQKIDTNVIERFIGLK